jgi:hypothetical protein
MPPRGFPRPPDSCHGCEHVRWIAAVLFMPLATAAAPPVQRPHDPVVVHGAQLAALPDRDTARLRLYRFRADVFEQVRHQFDARDEHGDIALDQAEFTVRDRDELCFMVNDAGERASAELLPPESDAALELEISDPRAGTHSWVYLLHFTNPPARTTERPYVEIDAAGRRARSPYYEVEYADGRNFFTGFRVLPAAGGDGRNLLRQTKMLGEPTLRLLFADLQLRFDERSTIVRVESTKTGPVRAIRQVRLSVDLGRFFPELPNGTVHTYHYATAFDTPSRVSVPWLVLKALRGFRFENVAVFDPAVEPLRYWDEANPDGVDLAAAPTAALRTDGDHDWWAVGGRAGTMLQAVEIPSAWKRWGITRGSVLRPELDAGGPALYAAGYSLLNMTRLQEHGIYQIRQVMMVLPGGYHPGDESGALGMLRAPLQVSVRRLR